MESVESQSYRRLRESIFEGPLSVVREELLVLLERVFVWQVCRFIEGSSEYSIEELTWLGRDFADRDSQNNLLQQALTLASDPRSSEEKQKLVKVIQQGMTPIELSPYAYEVLLSVLEREHLPVIREFLFSPSAPPLKTKPEPKSLPDAKLSYAYLFTRLYPEEIKQINGSKLISGLEKSDYTYWTRLLNAVHGTSWNKEPASSDPSANYSLGKRLLQLEKSQGSVVSSGLPPSLAFRTALAQAMLSSKSQTTQIPSILKIGLVDYYSRVTVVTACPLFQIFLFGTCKGKIKAIYFDKNEECNRIDNEKGRVEQSEREAERDAEGNPIVQEDFGFSLNTFEFRGHKSAITALSIKSDRTKMVSAAVDGEIRVWDLIQKICTSVHGDHLESVGVLSWAPRGEMFLSGGSEASILLWAGTPTSRIRDLTGHLQDISHAVFSPNSLYVISSALDNTLRVWEVSTGECKRVIRLVSHFTTFAISLTGDVVIGGCENGQILFVDIQKNSGHVFFKSYGPERAEKAAHGITQSSTSGLLPTADSFIRGITLSPDEKYYSIVKKDQVCLCLVEDVYKIRKEVEILEEKKDMAAIEAIWKRDFKNLCVSSFEGDKLDIITQSFLPVGNLVIFCRQPSDK